MSHKRIFSFFLILFIAIAATTVWRADAYYANLMVPPVSQHETIVLGQSQLIPGSTAAMRVVVRDALDAAPMANASVRVSMKQVNSEQAEVVFEGETDEAGTAAITFPVPDTDTPQTLIIETKSQLGEDIVAQTVTMHRDYRLLLSTDKPLYQPGQMIHLRILALSTFDQRPASGQPLTITIADGKNNQVFRQNLTTTEFGVAAADFQLAGEVNTGTYHITAEMGTGPITTAEKTVNVEYYALPKFDIALSSDKQYYQPGDHVQLTLDASYFFGKDVTEARVTLEGFTFDFERTDLFTVQGATDAQGMYEFEFDLPDYVVATDLDGGIGRFYLNATVVDQANQIEQKGISLAVAQSPLIIEAVAEGGKVRPGVENIIYVLTSYPDGTPAEAILTVRDSVTSEEVVLENGRYGLAQYTITPNQPHVELQIQAADAQGNQAQRSFSFRGSTEEETILLRPDRPIYTVGDTMNLAIYTTQPGSVYLDIVREGQTIATQAVQLTDNQAEVAVDLSPDLFGTLEIHAYKIMPSGRIVRDTRLVVVDEATDLEVVLATDLDEYRPGDTAELNIDTSGVPTAVGLAIVDEAVFALAEQDPGFAKLYFQLEQELLQPKYELHGFSIPDFFREQQPTQDEALQQAREGAAQASLSDTALSVTEFSLRANTHAKQMQEIMAKEREIEAQQAKYVERRQQAQMMVMNTSIMLLVLYALTWLGRTVNWTIAGSVGALLVLGIAAFWINSQTQYETNYVEVEVTRVVTETIVEEGETVEVTRVVTETVVEIVEVTAEDSADEVAGEKDSGSSNDSPPRLRQFFPETMVWLPNEVTDENGRLTLDIPVADSITTWRMTALASSQDGRIGSTTSSLRVFQDFFIDLNLPQHLTVGDEVSIPVGVFNYLPHEQEVTLTVEDAFWYDLLEGGEQTMTITANNISVVYFPIRVTAFGNYPFTVTAIGDTMSDAIQKPVRVVPNGKQMFFTDSDIVAAGETAVIPLTIPNEAINGSQHLTIKIYPGMVSQVVDGLDSILRMPSGCFEQTSSSNYPNTLVLDYLQTNGSLSPEVQFKAEDLLNIGYQRLMTFEVDGGGFSLFGEAPASVLLSAFAIQEFSDMSRVHPVDQDLIQRTAVWLMQQQNEDGSWGDQSWVEGTFISGPQGDPTLTTAYVLWSLARAGFVNDGSFWLGLNYLQQAEVTDAYTLGIVANALVETEAASQQQGLAEAVLAQLAAMAEIEGETAVWRSDINTFMGGSNDITNLEATALATLAFLHSQSHLDLAEMGLLHLIQNKDSFGNWETTQTTVLSLQTFIENAKIGSANVDAAITVRYGNQTRTITVDEENFDVVQMVTFDDVQLGESEVEIEVAGDGRFMYQVSGHYYLPWETVPTYASQLGLEEAVKVNIVYDRSELRVDDTVLALATVALNVPNGRADWALLDLGIPPGFSVNRQDLDTLVASYDNLPANYTGATIEKYELTGRQILVYISNLSEGQPLAFTYSLTANYPLRAQTPPSTAYDYYNPSVAGEDAPQLLVVNP